MSEFFAGPGLTNINVSASGGSNDLSAITFQTSPTVTFGLAGSVITASAAGGVGGGSVNISAGTTNNNLTNFSFADSNGVSFGLNGSTITATVQTNYLTTAMASNRGSDFVQATAAFAGTNASGTINSTGISVSVGNYITTAMASNRGSDFVAATAAFAGTNVSGTIASNGISVSVGNYITTAMASNRGSDFVAATAAFAGTNASGTIASNGISVSVAAPGGANTLSYFEPTPFGVEASATSSAGIDTLHVIPFAPPYALSFGAVYVAASASHKTTTAGNTYSFSNTGAVSHRFRYAATIGNTNFVDLFLFSKGAAGFSSELETFASTRLTFGTNQSHTYDASVTNGAGSTGSVTLISSVSVMVTFPGITSGTATSVNAASTVTTWGFGYSTWTSSQTTSVTNTYNTTTTGSTSLAGTYPATTAWASMKLVPLHFATSVSMGEYWLGMKRSTSTSSASGSSTSNVAAGRTYTTTINASNLTVTDQLTYLGHTNVIASSLGTMGGNTVNFFAPLKGHGSFSATWASNATYLNNAGNPNGAIAFSQIRTNVSFFSTWFAFDTIRVGS